MWAVITRPKTYSLGDDFVSGSSIAGRVIYLESSNRHGIIVGPTWYTAQTWDSLKSLDNSTINGYSSYSAPTENEFTTYIQPMLNETQTDYLPWGDYDGWPSSEDGITLWWTGTEQSPTAGYAYNCTTDNIVAVSKTANTGVGILIRRF